MDLRSLLRPAAQLFSSTTARTKRALKIAPHDSFLPDRTTAAAFPAADSIIYNPPASEPSPAHTPFIFLPRSDPRRQALVRMRRDPDVAPAGLVPQAVGEEDLPPAMRYKRRDPRYHLKREHIEEMRRLRNEDPLKWSVGHLAQKFDCSPIFVQMAAPAPAEHLAWLKAKMERKMARWGPIRTQAREDRKRRAEMLYRGEL
ncbi:YmL20 [Cladobotryum mycophilum]|uniref:YmL20 n=1 Tax=Cladobotryum mycophilum TaxID=491253 RepID=A0ABR0SJA9_9HYPO